MYAKVITTITTEIDLDTMTPEYSVSIEAGVLPGEVAYAAALGGCRATIRTIEEEHPRLARDGDG